MNRLSRRQPAFARALARIHHPETILVAVLMTAAAVAGWLLSPFWLAVAVAAQLAIGGLGAVWLIGPAQPELGFARYATLAGAGVALTLFGRVAVPAVGLLLAPVAVILLWAVVRLELDLAAGHRRVGLDLALVGIVFAGAAGIAALVPVNAWPPGLIPLLLIVAVPALRAAEARGRSGIEAVGQAALQLVAIAQVAAAVGLLRLPGVVGAAVIGLAFHAWAGAAEALDDGASGRSVIIEFGALAALGLVVALLLYKA
ncbi:MAG TPA: hypothetical protein VH987_09180 [Candidatus Limnocylindria bacterium]|jgi:hypothetical protein